MPCKVMLSTLLPWRIHRCEYEVLLFTFLQHHDVDAAERCKPDKPEVCMMLVAGEMTVRNPHRLSVRLHLKTCRMHCAG